MIRHTNDKGTPKTPGTFAESRFVFVVQTLYSGEIPQIP
jgi:hypothetical protein